MVTKIVNIFNGIILPHSIFTKIHHHTTYSLYFLWIDGHTDDFLFCYMPWHIFHALHTNDNKYISSSIYWYNIHHMIVDTGEWIVYSIVSIVFCLFHYMFISFHIPKLKILVSLILFIFIFQSFYSLILIQYTNLLNPFRWFFSQ